MRILVTGGSGFLGSHTIGELAALMGRLAWLFGHEGTYRSAKRP